MNDFNRTFNALINVFSGKTSKEVQKSDNIYQVTIGEETIIFGSETLRFTYANNRKKAMISFNPANMKVGAYERELELNISVMTSSDSTDGNMLNRNYSRLYIDGGELFQLSTIYDYDFLIMKSIMTKYLELLKVIKTNSTIHPLPSNFEEAFINVNKAVLDYNNEA